MKRSRLVGMLLLPAALIFAASTAFAQGDNETIAPDGQFGFQAGTHGVGAQYAVSPSFQIGTTLGIQFGDVPSDLFLDPYVKWLFEGDVNPYAKAGASFTIPGERENGITPDSWIDIVLLLGLEYYVTPNFGVFGEFGIFEMRGENNPAVGDGDSDLVLGLSPNGHVGVEWFLD